MLPNAICIVAKCPTPGKSKTRLSSACPSRNNATATSTTTTGLTDEGCAQMAKAMLCDVLMGIHNSSSLSSVVKFLYHAPADDDGRQRMGSILDELDIPYISGSFCGETDTKKQQQYMYPPKSTALPQTNWYLRPMPDASQSNLRSSDLGSKLAGMLEQTRTIVQNEFGDDDAPSSPAVAFLGMDSPELPIEEIAYALQLASGQASEESAIDNNKGLAYINPSHDGGYGMLCLPPQAPPSVFEGVRWSDPLTAVSQIKAVSDEGIVVTIGSLMRDIDEMEDLLGLAKRLRLARSKKYDGNESGEGKFDKGDKLLRPPPGRDIEIAGPDNDNRCHYSWEAIQQLEIGC